MTVAEPLARSAREQPEPDAARLERLEVLAFEIPTDGPDGKEADGTLEWDSTTIVVVVLHAGGEIGLGYTYGPRACASLVVDELSSSLLARDALAVNERWLALAESVRNAGRPGLATMAISAVDVALWDVKARLLGVPLVDLLDRARDAVPIYGSGGFCNYPAARLREQLGGWVELGIPRVKLKTSRNPGDDPARLAAARNAIGDDADLYVDANGALSRKDALAWAHRFHEEWGVSWFEEPVSSADFDGLRLVRDRGPRGLDVAAGEYVYVLRDAVNLLEAGAVDCLQLDVTRCGGITGLTRLAAAAEAHALDVSGHGAPQLSAHALCAVHHVRHLEYFHDHVRVESLAFDGVLEPEHHGLLRPDRSRPGHGLALKRRDLEERCVFAAERTT
jgi:L-alanine-DL-glutamate epimerase-like enolase superfamily enzyme